MAEAAAPPTRILAPVRWSMPGARPRMSLTSVAVAAALGPLAGITSRTASGALADRVAVMRTSGWPDSAESSWVRVLLALRADTSATTSRGPLKPAPKSPAMSEAAVWELRVGSSALAGSPRLRCRAGTASSARTAMTAIASGVRRRTTNAAHRWPASILAPGRARRGRDEARTLWPAKPSMAGSSVTEISSASRTAPAPVNPITARNGIPVSARPHSATATVRAAKTTELPAVPAARATDSCGAIPAWSWVRCRYTLNGQRGDQRDARGGQRAEHDEQHDQGDEHPDELG